MRTLIILLSAILVLSSCTKDSSKDAENSELVTVNNLQEFDTKVNSGVSLVFFHATWCSKCAAQRPEVEALIGDGELSHVFMAQVDFEKNPDIKNKYNVFGFPTILIIKDGDVRHTLTGQNNKREEIKTLLKAL
jgi:thioredoxin 1